MRASLALLLLPIASIACSKSDAPEASKPAAAAAPSSAPSAASSSASPALASVAASYEGHDVTFRYGVAHASPSGIEITLTNESLACDASQYGPGKSYLRFILPPGTSRSFFAGHPVGVTARFGSGEAKLKRGDADAFEFTTTVAPFELKEETRLQGTVALATSREEESGKVLTYTATGTFEVPLCKDKDGYKGYVNLPNAAPAHPVSGKYDNDKFAAKTAIAYVVHDSKAKVDYIDRIVFFPFAATCKAREGEELMKANHFVVGDIGVTSKDNRLGAPQPIFPFFSRPSKDHGKVTSTSKENFGGASGNGWLTIDAMDWKTDGVIKGSVVATSEPKSEAVARAIYDSVGDIEGTFEGTVCVRE
jgi:hypothetical protein